MTNERRQIKAIDLFCGIGGFRQGFIQACERFEVSSKVVLSSDIDDACARSYSANYDETPVGDITQINATDIPDHDILLAGFPCQPFSIIGSGQGFLDTTRGTLFFQIARIIEEKRPKAFVLENVKRLVGHDKGKTIKTIMEILRGLGYACDYKVLNALDFGLPQKRERVWIVGFHGPWNFEWPKGNIPMKPLTDILEPEDTIPSKFIASDYIRNKRKESHESKYYPAIWHENKSGNIASYPYSCALRANGSYNYLLVNGTRRMTPRELLRLQGFPDKFKIVCTDEQTRTQAGNSLPVPVAEAVIIPIIQRLLMKDVYRHQHMGVINDDRDERTKATWSK